MGGGGRAKPPTFFSCLLETQSLQAEWGAPEEDQQPQRESAWPSL